MQCANNIFASTHFCSSSWCRHRSRGGGGQGPCGTKKLADIFRVSFFTWKGGTEHRYEGTPTRSHYTVQWVSVPANLLMENGYARHRCVCTAVCVYVRAWERLNRSMCWLRVADFGVNDWNLVRWDARISVFCGKDEWKVGRRCLRWRVSILEMGGGKSDGEKKITKMYTNIKRVIKKWNWLSRHFHTQNEAISSRSST